MMICWLLVVLVVMADGDISSNAFGSDRSWSPAAFGDFNSDSLIDVFVLRDGGGALDVLLASEREPLLHAQDGYRCAFDGYNVTSVVPGDFDGDAFMDVLLTTTRNDVRIIWGGDDRLNCSDALHPVISNIRGQPLAIDYNKDMIIDLFGVDENYQRTFWIFGNNRTTPPTTVHLNVTSEIRSPHSNAFLDINGDFIPDMLVMTYTTFEVWLGRSVEPGFNFSRGYELPIGSSHGHVGQSLFLDVELSGRLYLLLPLCFDSECLNSTVMIYDDEWKRVTVDFEDEDHNVWGFVPPNDETYTDTITMRGGDYNMDGYPDLLVTLAQKKSGEVRAFLVENVPCVVSEESACAFPRSYQILWKASNQFRSKHGGTPILAVFYDFYQDGILDFILLHKNQSTGDVRVSAYKNNLDFDANFIKVMVLTGLKNKKVPTTTGPLGKKKHNYGTNLPGPRISYSTLSQEGMPRAGICAQLPQSAHHPLHLPYSIFGLDRTPNFVDSLTVGLSNHSKTWTQLIPNSQIVVVPWPPNDPSQWKVQLFVTPGKIIEKSAVVCTLVCLFVGIIVAFMHWKEKRDDRLNLMADIAETSM